MGRRARIALLVALATAVCATLVFVGTGVSAPGRAPATPLTIGALFSLTGGGNVYGPQQIRAAKLAVAQLNAAGGVDGTPLRLDVIDDRSDPAYATAAMRKLIQRDQVLAVLGPTLSLVAVHADPVADQLRTPVVAVSNTAGGIVGKCAYPCTWIWRDSLGESVAVPANVSQFALENHPSSVAILHTAGDLLGQDEAALAAQAFRAENVSVLGDVPMPHAGSPQAAVTKALALKPAVLFVGSSFGAQAAQAINEARKAGFSGAILGGNTFNSGITAKLAGPRGVGAQSGAAWYAGNDFPANAQFITAYKQAFSEEPDQFAAQAFIGVQVLAAAFQSAHLGGSGASVESQRAAVQRALGNTALMTPLGPFRFTAEHDVQQIVWVLAMDGRGGHQLAGFCDPGC